MPLGKLHAIWNIFLTKCKISSHEAAKKELSLHMCTSTIATEFLPTGFKNKEQTF